MRKISLAVIALILLGGWPTRVTAQVPDRQLGERVAATIRSYSQYTIYDYIDDIQVNNGAVTLTGRVTHQQKRDDIGARVAKVQGVRELTNKITVLPLSAMDQALRPQISYAIYNHPLFWHYAQMSRPPIHIVVENAQVTLEGVVKTEAERSLANSLARVSGTLEVRNRLRLEP